MITFDPKISLDTLLMFLGSLFVAWQIHDAIRQGRLASQIQLQAINRELIAMGFEKPELFEILKDTGKADPELERRYLQLWLNQLSLFYSLKSAGVMEKDYDESCERDVRDMFERANMRRHWKDFGKFYPVSFQKAVNAIINETGD